MALADGTVIPARSTVWAGGLQTGRIIAESGVAQGKGGRIDVTDELRAPGVEGVYVLGDSANITDAAGVKLPQLASVARQSGKWAARNIHADLTGGKRQPFDSNDRGHMAMVGRGAAVAELGRRRIQLQCPMAFVSWLAVHLARLPGFRQKIRALSSWAAGYLAHGPTQVFVGKPDQRHCRGTGSRSCRTR